MGRVASSGARGDDQCAGLEGYDVVALEPHHTVHLIALDRPLAQQVLVSMRWIVMQSMVGDDGPRLQRLGRRSSCGTPVVVPPRAISNIGVVTVFIVGGGQQVSADSLTPVTCIPCASKGATRLSPPWTTCRSRW